MKFKHTVFAFVSLLSLVTHGQENVMDNIVGKSIVAPSKIMGDARTIKVYLPQSYDDSDKKYPVLYLLDGERYFLHGVDLLTALVGFEQTPELIIVGIAKNASDRNRVYTVQSDQYLEFIEKEIISYIDTNFRSSGERLLFGWAFGGGFVIEAMIEKSNLFDGYIAASPFPLKNKISRIDSLLRTHPKFDKLLYFSSETSEGLVKEGTQELDLLLKEKIHSAINWTVKELESEEHRSTPYTTLYHGLTQYFQNFPELQFNSLEAFEKAGGIAFVYNYYKKRASLYGFSDQPSDWTMFSLARNAIRANDFEEFDALVNEFERTHFIERLRISRACEIADFYLQHKQLEKALELYNLLTEKHPNTGRPLIGLGNTYKEMNQTKKASKYYRKAKKLTGQ